MAWRFQASKFKNTTPKVPKKEDTLFDLPIGNLSCTDNGIHVNQNYIAFHIEGEGGKLGFVTVGSKGRRLRKDIGIVCAHGDLVDDFAFMPFAPDIMATCSRDDRLKLWQLSPSLSSSLSLEIDLGQGVLLECLRPHSTASQIVAAATTGAAFVVDVEQKRTVIELGDIVDKAMCMDWSPDGKLLAVSADKGRQVCVFDPRSGSSPIQSLTMHQGMGREARVLFCGDRLLSSGFTNKRVQEVRLVDTGKWGAPIHTQEFVSTTGVLIPHFDPDTKIAFLAGKGTNKTFLLEMQDRQPLMSSVYELTLPEQTLGSALGCKRGVSVMDGEVDTFYQLTKSNILPVSCIVPRRSYRDFHADLFPDTLGSDAGCTSSEWLQGTDRRPAKVSMSPTGAPLNPSPPPQEPTPPRPAVTPLATTPAPAPVPSKAHVQPPPEPSTPAPAASAKNDVEEPTSKPEVREIDYHRGSATNAPTPPSSEQQEAPKIEREPVQVAPTITKTAPTTPASDENAAPANSPPTSADKPTVRLRYSASDVRSRPLSTRVRPKSCVVGQITSKYRHVETLIGAKAHNAVFSNLRNVNTRLPPESNGACASGMYVAVPLSGPAGVVGIYDVDEPGKLPDGVMDGVFNKAQVTDMQWNPFDDSQLAVGTDCGCVNIWQVAKEETDRREKEPAAVLSMGGEKILTLRWHPLAENLLAVALSDNSVEMWDVKERQKKRRMVSHSSPVLSMAWSADGRYLVTVGRDSMMHVLRPQTSDEPVLEKKVLESTRAARVLFACDDRLIILVSLTKSSGRQVQLFDSGSLALIYSQQIDNATQPLVPHYDYDSSVLFLSGKGDRIVNMFEVSFDSPYLLPLTAFMAPMGGQAIAFHNKKRCDVMAVEFQRGWRLTEKSLEQIIFRVPRVKKDVFQSDLFPDALVTWRPALSASDWLEGKEAEPIFESLKPSGVNALASPAGMPQQRLARRADHPEVEAKGGEPEKKEVEASWSSQIQKDTRLEQDRMEGVAEEEWAA